MDSGRLSHRKVGSHRRIALEDLLAYAKKMRATQVSALERMAQIAHELGLDYEWLAMPATQPCWTRAFSIRFAMTDALLSLATAGFFAAKQTTMIETE